MAGRLIYKSILKLVLSVILIACFVLPFPSLAQKNEFVGGQSVRVSLTVPVMPEFRYVISKNSKISLAKNNLKLGEDIEINVIFRTVENKPLKNQSGIVKLVNLRTKKALLLPIKTGQDGLATIRLKSGEDMLGKNSVEVINSTYGELIAFKDVESFNIRKTIRLLGFNL